ncbi:MAG: ribosomal-processing cysteine protease Prp [Faecalibacterium sp.]|nr:ribosomal-processing cysteine protease Prp [Ruminococcus sp.]MCM1391947.1 ribosomal-processing cysteine protease Prp [Ruminococcus sp.]MCM1484975.1 ribosomal-processing cysteine protease Prp [Faecalibacterium sp.]
MIKVKFYSFNNELSGFEISGHSGYSEEGSDIVCASVSSCAYMTANTITDVIGVDAEIQVDDAYLCLTVAAKDTAKIKDIMHGFEMHMKALANDYSDYIICEKEIIQ